MNEPLVSIIMPAYNAGKFIKEAINSVQKQNYNNWELLVCDDCSTDNTVRIVESIKKLDSRIKLLKLEENSGAAIARNTSIEKAKGVYIAFLDSDDLWNTTKLRKQIEFMMKNDVYFTCTYYKKINSVGSDLNTIVKYKERVTYNGLLLNCPGNSTVIYNSEVLGKFYISDLKKRNDYLMWIQVIKASEFLNCYPEVLSSHRLISGSLSNKKSKLIKYHWHIYRRVEKISVFKSVLLLNFWVFKGIFNKFKMFRK
ncbi:glycosyltransferase family 2 protein [Vagococcus fluvialis]|uniref:glycosyltransferase family 2 protein n=1 Tax=Vagococcus fluvialis TaxID=2738 RepID=UPI003B5BBB67